jgi:hypothetical protein
VWYWAASPPLERKRMVVSSGPGVPRGWLATPGGARREEETGPPVPRPPSPGPQLAGPLDMTDRLTAGPVSEVKIAVGMGKRRGWV